MPPAVRTTGWPAGCGAHALSAGEAVHLVGIGGAGMQALAWAPARGLRVRRLRPRICAGAGRADAGATVHAGDAAHLPVDASLVIVSPAVPADNAEVAAAVAAGVPVVKGKQLLGALVDAGRGVGVSGTHGKTTTTGLIGHIVRRAELDASVFVGADVPDLGGSAVVGAADVVIYEADEYDRSFLFGRPRIAVITSIEHDHRHLPGARRRRRRLRRLRAQRAGGRPHHRRRRFAGRGRGPCRHRGAHRAVPRRHRRCRRRRGVPTTATATAAAPAPTALRRRTRRPRGPPGSSTPARQAWHRRLHDGAHLRPFTRYAPVERRTTSPTLAAIAAHALSIDIEAIRAPSRLPRRRPPVRGRGRGRRGDRDRRLLHHRMPPRWTPRSRCRAPDLGDLPAAHVRRVPCWPTPSPRCAADRVVLPAGVRRPRPAARTALSRSPPASRDDRRRPGRGRRGRARGGRRRRPPLHGAGDIPLARRAAVEAHRRAPPSSPPRATPASAATCWAARRWRTTSSRSAARRTWRSVRSLSDLRGWWGAVGQRLGAPVRPRARVGDRRPGLPGMINRLSWRLVADGGDAWTARANRPSATTPPRRAWWPGRRGAGGPVAAPSGPARWAGVEANVGIPGSVGARRSWRTPARHRRQPALGRGRRCDRGHRPDGRRGASLRIPLGALKEGDSPAARDAPSPSVRRDEPQAILDRDRRAERRPA
ncbi:MAG: Mur ligase domain-containing protein [Candidatus Binatia bacterium]